jgi:hypothetical protein
MLHPDHARHLTALPRVSVNGLFQRRGDAEILVSGLPTLIRSRGRRLDVA